MVSFPIQFFTFSELTVDLQIVAVTTALHVEAIESKVWDSEECREYLLKNEDKFLYLKTGEIFLHDISKLIQ